MPMIVNQKNQGNSNVVSISGYIDESAVFPPLAGAAHSVTIDLAHVTGLNSVGTRNWCTWIGNLKAPTPIQLVNCPAIIVKTFNTVLGAYPVHVQAVSFFVPFYSEKDSSRKDFLYRLDREFTRDGTVKNPQISDALGNAMELDVLPNFFRFLKR